MNKLQQINNNLLAFEKVFKIPVVGAQQGSETWLKLKLGVLSASNASKIVAKKDSETRLTYMSELVAQVCTGEQEELNSKYLDWGKQYEPAARSSYEFATGLDIAQVPFVFKDDTFREGCSPDGVVSDTKGVEIKCPWNAANFVKFFTEDKVKKDYEWQMQFQMRAMNCETFDMVQYHPHMKKNPLKVLTFARDEEKQKTLNDAVPQFISDMNVMLDKIGVKFGDQWRL